MQAMLNRCLLYILLSVLSFSCGKIKHEGKKIVSKTKEKVENKAADAVDKVIPTFDADKPDTKFNKKRFRQFLEIEPGADVKNILCADDAIGIDAAYKFTFTCDDTTINRIVKKLHLKNTPTGVDGIDFGADADWWDISRLNKLTPYWKTGANETYWYLLYD